MQQNGSQSGKFLFFPPPPSPAPILCLSGLSAMVMEPGYEMLNKDTLPEVVVMLSQEEKDKEVVPVRVERYHDCEVESVVGVEKQIVFPHHCGSVHTPLPRPATIPEKGVELKLVVTLQKDRIMVKGVWMI